MNCVYTTRRHGYAATIDRRGVASVLAMMFLVIFGSLAAAMAVVAHGNMRTANSALQLSRAMSAAETGLVFASIRLQEEASRFVIDKGVVDANFAERLWMGTYTGADGTVTAPPQGPGVVHAVRAAHVADVHSFEVEPSDAALPAIDGFGTLRVKPIALSALGDGSPNPNGTYFRLRYELLTGVPYIRVTSQGVDGTIKRTLEMDFKITKKIEYAVLSVNRIMIGKNVIVEGPLGSRYGIETGELDCVHCHPILARSDFYYLDPALDSKLDTFFARVAQYDVDGDGRLRPNHPVESLGLAGTPFVDYTGDGYVDDYDIFLQHFDSNGDGMVVYDSALAAAAGLGSLAVEFNADPQLARLIDGARPDRNGDGLAGTFTDTQLGWMDGVLDGRDLYAKVRGRLDFAVARSDWEAAHGGSSFQEIAVRGAVRPGIDRPAVRFEVDAPEMIEVTTEMVDESNAFFSGQASGSLAAQAASQGGPSGTIWEGVPYGAYAPYDWYERTVYEDMTFTNVRIPMGTNALFKNCTFVGVTFVETHPDNTDVNWNYAGALMQDPNSTDPTDPASYIPSFPGIAVSDATIGADTRDWSNNIRFHDCTFLGSISGIRPLGYAHWRNKIQMTGETRFYLDADDPDLNAQPDAAVLKAHLNSLSASAIHEMAKSSILMPGWSFDVGAFTSDPSADPTTVPRIKLRGIIMAGVFDIRGVADVHGTLLMTFRPESGAGPLFYAPNCSPCMAAFNTTIGYFGPEDGDGEGIGPDQVGFDGFGEIRLRYDPNALLPDGIPWPLKVEPVVETYTEGGVM